MPEWSVERLFFWYPNRPGYGLSPVGHNPVRMATITPATIRSDGGGLTIGAVKRSFTA